MSPANREQIVQAMRDEVLKAQIYQKRYEAAIGLYQAACLDNHGQEADLNRNQLHAILDLQLDCLATIQMLQRQLLSIGG